MRNLKVFSDSSVADITLLYRSFLENSLSMYILVLKRLRHLFIDCKNQMVLATPLLIRKYINMEF